MLKEDAIKLALSLANKEKKHPDYDRVVKKADEYMKLITGENIESLLIQFVQRESMEMFRQRVQMTQSITPAIFNSIMTPFYKAARNDKIIKRFDFKEGKKNEVVSGMISGFFGSSRKKNKGLDHWFKTKFPHLSFIDPNMWVITEWVTPEMNKAAEPHPYEVTSKEAVNWKFDNEDLKWLFIQVDYTYETLNDKGEIEEKTGTKWTLYEEDNTIVICPFCKKKRDADGEEIKPNEFLTTIKEKEYLISAYEPKLGYVPAFRVGYREDGYTKGRTFVSPAEPAMPYLRKSIKTVSELDLSMTLHAFPQKLQYVEKCQGASREKRCNNGMINGTSNKCEVCKGSGYKIHTTAQDAILLPMPESKEEMYDLNNMLVYKTPPIDLIEFQDKYVRSLKTDAHLAIFNSQIFVNPLLAKTATEVDDNMQSVYDTLEPYTEKISETYMDFVYTFAHLAAVNDPESKENVHRFPADLKLKTTTILLNELKLVNDSGAPSFMRDAISEDLAAIIYTGDDLGLSRYATKHRFFPFNGKNPDEIAMLMSSQYVSEFTKVLYSNFEAIFTDIELENPGFWFMNSYSKQWKIVQEKTFVYLKELQQADPLRVDFGEGVDPDIDTTDPNSKEDASKSENPGTKETTKETVIQEELIA